MTPKSIPSFFLLCLLFIACSKENTSALEPDPIQQEDPANTPDPVEEEPTPETYFTLISRQSQSDPIMAEWIVVHDSNGQILDYGKYVEGQTLVFETAETVTDLLNVTKIRVEQFDYGKKFTITTTTKISKGSNWTLKPLPELSDYYTVQSTGTPFSVFVDGVPDFKKLTATNMQVPYEFTGSSITYPGNPPRTNFELNLDLYSGLSEFYLTVLDGYNQLKYLHFTYDNADISAQYSDFQDFEIQYGVILPEFESLSMEVAGYPEGAPYDPYYGAVLQRFLVFKGMDIPTQPLAYGYLDTFDRYRTFLSVSMMGSRQYNRMHYGPRLENLEVPNPSFSVTNVSLQQFRFQTDSSYESVRHRWKYIVGSGLEGNLYQTYWYVEAPFGYEPIVGELPEEILTEYPELEVEALEYNSSKLNFSVGNGEEGSFNNYNIGYE